MKQRRCFSQNCQDKRDRPNAAVSTGVQESPLPEGTYRWEPSAAGENAASYRASRDTHWSQGSLYTVAASGTLTRAYISAFRQHCSRSESKLPPWPRGGRSGTQWWREGRSDERRQAPQAQGSPDLTVPGCAHGRHCQSITDRDTDEPGWGLLNPLRRTAAK